MNVPLTQEEIDQPLQSKSVSDRSTCRDTTTLWYGSRHSVPHSKCGYRCICSGRNMDAIADILSRHRTSRRRRNYSKNAIDCCRCFVGLRFKDSAVNLAYASLGTGRALSILLSVRRSCGNAKCAAAGLRCFCLSQDAMLDDTRGAIVEIATIWLADIQDCTHRTVVCGSWLSSGPVVG